MQLTRGGIECIPPEHSGGKSGYLGALYFKITIEGTNRALAATALFSPGGCFFVENLEYASRQAGYENYAQNNGCCGAKCGHTG